MNKHLLWAFIACLLYHSGLTVEGRDSTIGGSVTKNDLLAFHLNTDTTLHNRKDEFELEGGIKPNDGFKPNDGTKLDEVNFLTSNVIAERGSRKTPRMFGPITIEPHPACPFISDVVHGNSKFQLGNLEVYIPFSPEIVKKLREGDVLRNAIASLHFSSRFSQGAELVFFIDFGFDATIRGKEGSVADKHIPPMYLFNKYNLYSIAKTMCHGKKWEPSTIEDILNDLEKFMKPSSTKDVNVVAKGNLSTNSPGNAVYLDFRYNHEAKYPRYTVPYYHGFSNIVMSIDEVDPAPDKNHFKMLDRFAYYSKNANNQQYISFMVPYNGSISTDTVKKSLLFGLTNLVQGHCNFAYTPSSSSNVLEARITHVGLEDKGKPVLTMHPPKVCYLTRVNATIDEHQKLLDRSIYNGYNYIITEKIIKPGSNFGGFIVGMPAPNGY